MNCKPGDLAVIVGAASGSALGAIVEVLRMKRPSCPACGSVEWWILFRGEEWGGCDKDLRPIRPGEGDDETLSWAGKPEQVAA